MNLQKITPVCPVFGQCGGCQYQDLSYAEELKLKHDFLRELFSSQLKLPADILSDIVPSGCEYHYRSRLDMKFLQTRSGETFMGFSPPDNSRVVEVQACPIALEAISDFLPELKRQAAARLPARYRNANLVVKTGDDKRVLWGGIGRRSLRLPREDYLWTRVKEKKIFYSLETFFQANLSILGNFCDGLEAVCGFDDNTVLYDLYAGVGLFGVLFAKRVKRVVLIEENTQSVLLAKYNAGYHNLDHCQIIAGQVEQELPLVYDISPKENRVAIIDPPRKGLSPPALKYLSALKSLRGLFYLSCQPQALARDIRVFMENGWHVTRIVPFDFFPRTKHIETLAVLHPA